MNVGDDDDDEDDDVKPRAPNGDGLACWFLASQFARFGHQTRPGLAHTPSAWTTNLGLRHASPHIFTSLIPPPYDPRPSQPFSNQGCLQPVALAMRRLLYTAGWPISSAVLIIPSLLRPRTWNLIVPPGGPSQSADEGPLLHPTSTKSFF